MLHKKILFSVLVGFSQAFGHSLEVRQVNYADKCECISIGTFATDIKNYAPGIGVSVGLKDAFKNMRPSKLKMEYICVSKKTNKICGYARFFIGNKTLTNTYFLIDRTCNKNEQIQIIKTMIQYSQEQQVLVTKITFVINNQDQMLIKTLIEECGFFRPFFKNFNLNFYVDILEKKI
jgi:hypothetical protein